MKNILPYSLLILIGGFLWFVSYRLVCGVQRPSPELHLSIKSFKNTSIELRYQIDAAGDYSGEPDKFFLHSSQFFSTIILPLNQPEKLDKIRLDFNEADNTIMMEKMWLVVKHNGKRDTVSRWKGDQLNSLILRLNDMNLETMNSSFIQLTGGTTDPYIEFNEQTGKILEDPAIAASNFGYMQIFAALLLTLTLLTIFSALFSSQAYLVVNRLILEGQLLSFGFFLLIFIVFLNSISGLIPDLPNKENRKLSPKPNLNLIRLLEYPDLYSNYARDNYAFRNYFFFMNALLKSKVLGVSPLPDDVILGKKGWFFDNEQNVINDFRKLQPYDTSKLSLTSQILQQRLNWLTKKNIRFYIMITPNKNRVYPELMPATYTISHSGGHNYLDLLSAHLKQHTNVTIIDPTDALIHAKNKNDVYYSTDTHWNLYGGFIGYKVLLEHMKKDFPGLRPIDEKDLTISSFFNSEGDLAKMCGLQDIFKRKEYVLAFKDARIPIKNPESSSIELHYKNSMRVDSSRLKLVMFRDSYANYLIPYLNLHFEKASYIWSYEFLDQLIEREQPDIVVFECLQRFMNYSLVMPNSERVIKNLD